MAILEASRWIDASLQNKLKMAETVAQKSYINTSVDAINQRILGRYQNGMGKTWDDPNHMKFFNDGAVNFPYLSDGMWFLTQHKRWGLLKEHPDYLAVAKQINQIDLYKQAASASQDQRAQRRDAHLQADGRRGVGRQGPQEIRRRLQSQSLNDAGRSPLPAQLSFQGAPMVSAVFHSPLGPWPRALRPPKKSLPRDAAQEAAAPVPAASRHPP